MGESGAGSVPDRPCCGGAAAISPVSPAITRSQEFRLLPQKINSRACAIAPSPPPCSITACARRVLQFVPPDGNAARFAALVITLYRGFNSTGTRRPLHGIPSASVSFRKSAAATSAATSTHRTDVVALPRTPVTGDCIEPDTSG